MLARGQKSNNIFHFCIKTLHFGTPKKIHMATILITDHSYIDNHHSMLSDLNQEKVQVLIHTTLRVKE